MRKNLFRCMRHTCRRIPHFFIPSYGKLSVVNKDHTDCKADFRVEKVDIPILVKALRVPPIFKCANGTICDGTEGLCAVLKRFSYPCRYSDMIPIFRRSVSELSINSNEDIDWIDTEHGHRITQWTHSILDPTLLSTYANAVFDKGEALDNCFAFIDGTVRHICRPVVNQSL